MAQRKIDLMIHESVSRYVRTLQQANIPLWRLYLFGSCARGTNDDDSDIDLAVFLDRDAIDSFEVDLYLMRLRWDVDLRIEPHSFSRGDFEKPDPFVREILTTGQRIV